MASKFCIKDRLRSFMYAFRGWHFMLHKQYNFYIHLSLAVLAILMGFLLDLSRAEWLWIVLAIGLVLAAEIFNTAIEKLTDLIHADKHPKAGQVKDLAAGAVLVLAITALLIGLIIFVPRLIDLFYQ